LPLVPKNFETVLYSIILVIIEKIYNVKDLTGGIRLLLNVTPTAIFFFKYTKPDVI